ncbi:cytochrome-c peroxidase [Taibaiella koreensis]|uniref:cytochrome-c peroxidase n=1 Tax=Taibaiella koreensis TaxID=1268548 RepID=UPI000E59E65F|nr:cytochrome c peroxidase [Taibaiella koreensis]
MRRHSLSGYRIGVVLALVLLLGGCEKKAGVGFEEDSLMRIPAGFPGMPEPEDNRFSPERWALGKQLFYDNRLSLNNRISCGSCHKQELAFSDSLALSPGDDGAPGTSNAPSLANIGYHPYFTRAGGVPTLEMQILVPIQEHNEFNTSMPDIVAKLKQDTSYAHAALRTYGRPFDAFVLTRAIAQFERSFISGNSPFDAYSYAGNPDALTESEKRGYRLFTGTRANCSQCHSGFNFTNYAFENNGLYVTYADSGRMRFTHLPGDRARFKVPSLRNVALTAPYMHDGSLKTLEAVVAHYDSGGKDHVNKSKFLQPLHLTDKEKEDLINFLKSLTDDHFVRDKKFKL